MFSSVFRQRALCTAAILSVGGSSSIALAQQPLESDESHVVVTASRTPEQLSETLWSSTVLTRADIEARQPDSVQDLLRGLAGVDIANNGGPGKLSSVFIRGGESEHTLLLVDGVRVASASAGTAAFEFIPVEQIDRIEVVRGPRSTLYGTDAIGGVIQIFTRRKPQQGSGFGATVSGGSNDTRQVGADFHARGDRFWANVGLESYDTNGYNSCAGAALTAFAGCFADEPDDDGYRNNSGSAAVGYQLNDDWSAQLQSLITDGKAEYDGYYNSTEFTERVFSARLDGKLNETWSSRIIVGRNDDDQDYFGGAIRLDTFDTTRTFASVQFDGALTEGLRLVSGAEYQKDELESSLTFAQNSRDSQGAFAELHGQLGAWSALAGARYEDNEQFGSHVTGNVGLGRSLSETLRVTATWGTAFHAPTFNDLYHPFGSNPHLDPEESSSVEVGIEGKVASLLEWSLRAFETDIDKFMALDSLTYIPYNISEARIRGAEVQAGWRNAVWSLNGQYTRLDPKERGTDNLLPRRAKDSASVDMRWLWRTGSLGAVTRYQGERFDEQANTRRLGSYVTVDLLATQKIGKAFEVQARVANLFDRDYQTASYYLQDDRNFNLTLRYRFDANR